MLDADYPAAIPAVAASRQGTRLFCRIVVSLHFAVVALGGALPSPASAQAPGGAVLTDGNAVVTGFSGIQLPTLIAPGVDPIERSSIDRDGPVVRVIDLQAPGAPPRAQTLIAPKPFTVTAGQIGQVFGVALDNAVPPNIYVAATSVYGLPIVVPDANNDGMPNRAEEGTANATFMAGLFGPAAEGGSPGSIWRIDGTTGEVRLFANVTLDGVANSGPALGGLAFDPATNALLVADRETGMVHRFDMAGAETGRYDHGTQGRPASRRCRSIQPGGLPSPARHSSRPIPIHGAWHRRHDAFSVSRCTMVGSTTRSRKTCRSGQSRLRLTVRSAATRESSSQCRPAGTQARYRRSLSPIRGGCCSPNARHRPARLTSWR